MAQIQVTAAQLQDTKAQLGALISKLDSKIDETTSTVTSLKSMWEGDASDAFQQSYKQDEQKLKQSVQGLKTFENALSNIISQYQSTESANTRIAQSI